MIPLGEYDPLIHPAQPESQLAPECRELGAMFACGLTAKMGPNLLCLPLVPCLHWLCSPSHQEGGDHSTAHASEMVSDLL